MYWKYTLGIGLILLFLINSALFHVSGQKLPFINTPTVDIKSILRPVTSLVTVEYQSDSLVVLNTHEDIMLGVNGTMTIFWYTIDNVKQYGYSLSDVTTSGMGSQGNPTRFYAVLTKP